MHLILCYTTGRRHEAILLAASPGRMRVVRRRLNDTIELRLVEDGWVTDEDEPVEIESWISDGCTGTAGFFSRFIPRTHSACN